MSAFSPMKQKPGSVKYHKIDPSTYPVELGRHLRKETRCSVCLRRAWVCTGWALLFCLLAAAGLCTYHYFVKEFESPAKSVTAQAPMCTVDENNRFDCFPETIGVTQQLCEGRGCCWQAASIPNTAPYCFFPSNYNGYNVTDMQESSQGIDATLTRSTSTFFSTDVKTLKLQVEYQTDSRLRIRFYDPNNARYEVPMDVPSGANAQNPQYQVTVEKEPFNIVVKRVSTGATIFDTTNTAPLIFSDQYLQIATQLSTKYLYGLGEHRHNFLQDLTTWRRLVFWNRDDVPKVDNNGYGTHPFFLNLESVGGQNDAHGVFLLNSNAGEVAFQPFGSNQAGAITYRMLGGILDFYVVLGSNPLSVATQYADIIGLPYFPPFWSLGYHICKYGVKTAADLQNMINRNRAAKIPYDVQWSDIDYMVGYKDWTYDPDRYGDLPNIVKDLHDNQQRYIIMADPAISSEQPAGTYPPFDDGKQMDVFVKNSSGQILIGRVWPGLTAFPDFFHHNADQYWFKQASAFHGQLPFDGLWIDMNEPSSFIDGSAAGCPSSPLNSPPYLPPTIDGRSLVAKTICPSALHEISSHYNLHNMYGWSQANVTRRVLDNLYVDKRSPIISRSTYPGLGTNAGHWLGDNDSSWPDLFYSIPGILNFNLFGIPQIGADICGFRGTTTPELCTRWHQLGAFYPFMRDHAADNSPEQDPGTFQAPYVDYIRSAIQLRYRLLSVLYTLFFKAHTEGLPIVRPLFYLYSGTEDIDRQFMWGADLLVSPVLDQGATSVDAYIPDDIFYDFYNGTSLSQKGESMTLDAPLDRINVHVRGGSIITLLPATERTDISRQQKFQLLVALNADGKANGEFFWDDGASLDSIWNDKYTHILFNQTASNTLSSTVNKSGYNPSEGIKLGGILWYGVAQGPSSVTVNGQAATFKFDGSSKVLNVTSLDVDMLTPLSVTLQ